MEENQENPVKQVMDELNKSLLDIAKHLEISEEEAQEYLEGSKTLSPAKLIKLKRLVWLKRARDKRAEYKELGIARPRSPKKSTAPKLTGEDIKKIRLDAGLTQSRFADILDVSLPSVSNWERGGCQPRTQQALRILEFRHQAKAASFQTVRPSEYRENAVTTRSNEGLISSQTVAINFTALKATGIIDHGDDSISIYDEIHGLACRLELTPTIRRLLISRLQG